jgi:hypothetical protein
LEFAAAFVTRGASPVNDQPRNLVTVPDPDQLACFRWLLRRLFASYDTPPSPPVLSSCATQKMLPKKTTRGGGDRG